MGYPFGLAPDAQGRGTTPADLQRVIWSLYLKNEPLIVRGCEVSGTQGMAYVVRPGVVYLPTGDQRAVLVPVDAQTVQTDPAPGSGRRTDYIAVGLDGAVTVSSTRPSGKAVIDQREVSAGVSNTSATTGTADRQYAMLFGGSMGRLLWWYDGTPGEAVIPKGERTVYQAAINLSSDRLLDFRLTQCAVGDPQPDPLSLMWSIYIDGHLAYTFEGEVTRIAEAKLFARTRWTLAGEHVIRITVQQKSGRKNIHHKKGGQFAWPGNSFELIDVGLIW